MSFKMIAIDKLSSILPANKIKEWLIKKLTSGQESVAVE